MAGMIFQTRSREMQSQAAGCADLFWLEAYQRSKRVPKAMLSGNGSSSQSKKYGIERYGANGDFGADTDAAARKFQKARKNAVDGVTAFLFGLPIFQFQAYDYGEAIKGLDAIAFGTTLRREKSC